MGNQDSFRPRPPQMGTFNPQTMIPASSSNSNGLSNQLFPGQGPQNFNHPFSMNNMNNLVPQNLPFNSPGPYNFFNQNHNLGFANQMQDANQLLQLLMLNLNTQLVPGTLNIPQNTAFIANTSSANLNIPQNLSCYGNIQPANPSLLQNVGFHMNARPANLNLPQNVAFLGNTQLGVIDPSGTVQNMGSLNASNGASIATQQLPSPSFVQGTGPIPPSSYHTNSYARPLKLQGSEGNAIGNNMKNNEKSADYKNYKLNQKQALGNRIMKPRFQKMHNSGHFSSTNMRIRREKGKDNVGGRQISVVNSTIQDYIEEKRSIALNYTDREIRQWREARRKNYPSKSNIEKKLMEKMTKPELFDETAQLRRQQLKEVLARQAELGCEVAEIPSYYLLDSEQQVHEKKKDGKASNKEENFLNRFKKRGRCNDWSSNKKDISDHKSSDGFGRTDCVPKKKRSTDDDMVSHSQTRTRELSLLQKLLSAEIKRDKHLLLQAFQFMVLNSFFNCWPDKKLKFPVVIIKDTETRNDANVSFSGEIEQPIGENDNDDCSRKSKLKNQGPVVNFVQEIPSGEHQEEEGEIID